MSLRDRIGIDVGRRLRLEDALEWAAEHEVRWIDIQLDAGANALSSFDHARAAGVRRACSETAAPRTRPGGFFVTSSTIRTSRALVAPNQAPRSAFEYHAN